MLSFLYVKFKLLDSQLSFSMELPEALMMCPDEFLFTTKYGSS